MDKRRISTILIPVLSADLLIDKWRKKYVESSHHGIPFHITLLFPFIEPEKIHDDVVNRLKDFFLETKQFTYILSKIDTFPNIIFLEPSKKKQFIKLTEGLLKIFPTTSLYEGKFSKINPHATVANLNNAENFNRIRTIISKDLNSKLPIKAVAKEVWLMEKENNEWFIVEKFPFSLDMNRHGDKKVLDRS